MGDDNTLSTTELLAEIRMLRAQNEALRKNLADKAELRAEAEQFPSLLQTMAEGLAIINKEGYLVFVNKACCDTLGYETAEIIGQRVQNFVLPASAAVLEEQMALRQKGEKQRYELILARKDGQPVHVLVSPVPIYDDDHQYCGSLAILMDVTERKSILEELTHEHNLLRTLMDQLPDEVYVKDAAGRYLAANRAKVRRSNCSEEKELLGRTAFDLYPPELAKRLDEYDQQVLRSGEPVINSADQWELKNGGTEWTLTNKVPLRDTEGKVVGIVGITRDVTETRRTAEALSAASRMEATATLAGGIAHEFNNLMTIALLNTELLGMEVADNPSAQTLLETITRAANQAAGLAQQMLAFARGGKYRMQKLNLNETIQRMLRLKNPVSPPEIRMAGRYTGDLWMIAGDSDQMDQILLIMINNAIEAISGEGQILITTANCVVDEETANGRPGLKPGSYVHLSVQDTGSGMSDEVIRRAFEPFFTTRFQGRGLGLAAAYGIIKNHGGFIYAGNRPGGGAVFEVYLPRTGAAA